MSHPCFPGPSFTSSVLSHCGGGDLWLRLDEDLVRYDRPEM